MHVQCTRFVGEARLESRNEIQIEALQLGLFSNKEKAIFKFSSISYIFKVLHNTIVLIRKLNGLAIYIFKKIIAKKKYLKI